MSIHILSPEVANQIAAGEVVERPASAVKELIENSLDAGATDIRVEAREGGRRLIRVQDDGCGIPAAEAALAFERHATSKIATAADLESITTLGFRGEALASIAAVAQVTLLTRSATEEVGTLLRVAESRIGGNEPRGAPPGTTLTIEHLFANVPARLKFLKVAATEAGHIQQIVTRYALAYPERRFSLVSDGKLIFQSSGSGKLSDVLVKVYGLEMAREMLAVATKDEGRRTEDAQPSSFVVGHSSITVTGFIGAPSQNRANRSYITLFVNRRWFQDTSLAYSVIQAYHTMLPQGRYPVAVLFVEMDPTDVDVNVHPTKAEVRFRDSGAVFSAVQRAVRRTLADLAPVPQVTLGSVGPAPQGAPDPFWGQTPLPQTAPDAGWADRRAALLGAGREQGPGARGQESEPQPQSPIPNPQSLLPILRVVGQLGATYIIAEGPDGMYLIDQHAAHERVLYEQFMAGHAGQTLAVQPLLEPIVLDLSPEQAAVVAEELAVLNHLGVAIEPFGGASYLVRSLPALLAGQDPRAALAEIADGLASRDDVVEGAAEARLVTLICKRAAIKGGTLMSLPEMQELVRRLEACRSPRTCPHGRPTMIYLSATHLARQFGRT